jgi:hypothetical protein
VQPDLLVSVGKNEKSLAAETALSSENKFSAIKLERLKKKSKS